ncbi:MAG: NUDIX hydrolase [Leucobacter sp.]|nr:NUDIX hydrolase [Leucobacter sp.]
MTKPVLSAGTVCYRRVKHAAGETLMVLLVHRTKQRDVSFPKGKLDAGESMPQAAVRETVEETGLQVTLGINLGMIHYTLPTGGEKMVQYWAAEVAEESVHTSRFRPNSEISALEWVPAAEVASKLSYKADRQLFKVFQRLEARDAIDTFSVVLLRHAKAEPRSADWPTDHMRPLTIAGERQADTLVPTLVAFGAKRIYSSTATRCVSTVEPLSEYLGKKIRAREGLSQDAWDAGETHELRRIVGKVVRRGSNVVVCTHRPVLPDAARELALATGSLPGDYLTEAAQLPPAGFSVFHFSRKHPGAGVLCVETYPLKH